MRFEGLRILVTGGSGGLGRPLCAQLRWKGAKVTVLDRAPPADPTMGFLQHDISTTDGLEAAVIDVREKHWDVLINLAGVQHFGRLEDQAPDHLLASYMVNLVAPVRLTQAVLPTMKHYARGHIVNIGSIFGSINFAHFATYSSAKAGLRGFSQALRREVAGAGVNITYVAPRAVRTPLNTAQVMAFAKATGMRFDDPERIAGLILEAVRRKRAEAYFGFPESLFVRVNALLPGVVDRALWANDRKAATLFRT